MENKPGGIEREWKSKDTEKVWGISEDHLALILCFLNGLPSKNHFTKHFPSLSFILLFLFLPCTHHLVLAIMFQPKQHLWEKNTKKKHLQTNKSHQNQERQAFSKETFSSILDCFFNISISFAFCRLRSLHISSPRENNACSSILHFLWVHLKKTSATFICTENPKGTVDQIISDVAHTQSEFLLKMWWFIM